MRQTTGGDSESFQGAFVTFPSATLVDDPAGLIRSNYQSALLTTTQTPVLSGAPQPGEPFYDAAANRWVPASAAQTSPDGAAYAYGTKSAIHVVTVGDGTDRSVAVTKPADTATGIVVEAFDGTNVYYAVGSISGYPSGIWRFDVAHGTATAMAQVLDVFAVRDGKAWIGYLDPHDTTPPALPAGGGAAVFDTIVEVDLSTGARTTWFYRPGQSVRLLAIDSSGHPIVSANPGPDYFASAGEIRRLNEPGSGGEDNGELVYNGSMWFNPAQADGDRIWFGNDRGIYVYTTAGGLQKVMAFHGNGTLGESLVPAGFCR